MRTLTNVDYDHMIPFWDQVVVEVETPEEKSGGGIIIPDTVQDANHHAEVCGKVVALGPMAFRYNLTGVNDCFDVVIGDYVVFRPYAGDMHEAKNQKASDHKHRIMASQSIIGRLPRETGDAA